jgi:hypothetical protein
MAIFINSLISNANIDKNQITCIMKTKINLHLTPFHMKRNVQIAK